MKLPNTSNNSYHNGCQCHRTDLSAQPSLRKRHKNPQNPRYRKRIGFLSLHGVHIPKRARFHRDRCLVSPRPTPGITTNNAWYHRGWRRLSMQTLPWYHRKRRRLSLESMDLDTEQLPEFVTHNNLWAVAFGDLDYNRMVVFRETVCYNIYIQNSFL